MVLLQLKQCRWVLTSSAVGLMRCVAPPTVTGSPEAIEVVSNEAAFASA